MKNPFKVGDLVKLRPDVLGRHSHSIPPHAGFTTAGFQWRDTLRHLAGKQGKVTRVSPDSKHVNVEFEQPWESKDSFGKPYTVNTIGIDFTDLVPFSGEPPVQEGVGYVYAKDRAKDPKAIKGKRWTVKYENDHSTKSPVTETTIREVIQELLTDLKKKLAETRETPDKNYIIFGRSGPVVKYYIDGPNGPMMLQFGRDMARRFQTLEQVRNKIVQLTKQYKGITNWDYEIVQNPLTSDTPAPSPTPKRKGHRVFAPVGKQGEWIVRYTIDGKTDEGKTYFTDDKEDARDTYAYMLRIAAAENEKLGIK